MIFANSESRKSMRDLTVEFGVDLEDYGYVMNGGVPPKETSQTSFKAKNVAWSSQLYEPLKRMFTPLDRPVLFEDGVGLFLDQPNKN
jgi:hypothetical protein